MSDISKAYQEVSCILSKAPETVKNKVSKNVLDKIYQKRDLSYNVDIDITKPLESQNLLRSTKSLLALMYYDYWCKDQSERDGLAYSFYHNQKNKRV